MMAEQAPTSALKPWLGVIEALARIIYHRFAYMRNNNSYQGKTTRILKPNFGGKELRSIPFGWAASP
jgi:hypothetical protein